MHYQNSKTEIQFGGNNTANNYGKVWYNVPHSAVNNKLVLWILLKDGTLIIEVSAFLKWIFNFLQTNDEEGRFLQ